MCRKDRTKNLGKFVKHWKITENPKQRIDDIVYNNNSLALTIKDNSNRMRFLELRSMENFDRL